MIEPKRLKVKIAIDGNNDFMLVCHNCRAMNMFNLSEADKNTLVCPACNNEYIVQYYNIKADGLTEWRTAEILLRYDFRSSLMEE